MQKSVDFAYLIEVIYIANPSTKFNSALPLSLSLPHDFNQSYFPIKEEK